MAKNEEGVLSVGGKTYGMKSAKPTEVIKILAGDPLPKGWPVRLVEAAVADGSFTKAFLGGGGGGSAAGAAKPKPNAATAGKNDGGAGGGAKPKPTTAGPANNPDSAKKVTAGAATTTDKAADTSKKTASPVPQAKTGAKSTADAKIVVGDAVDVEVSSIAAQTTYFAIARRHSMRIELRTRRVGISLWSLCPRPTPCHTHSHPFAFASR
jgi:hypothetical protein